MATVNLKSLRSVMSPALSFFLLAMAGSTAAFGPQSSNKAQEWGFDFVEEFDGLQDWNQSTRGRVGNQWDSTLPDAMPKLANGGTSAWGYYSLWGEGNVSPHAWIGTTTGNRQVWRGTKSAAIDLGDNGLGPSRLGLFMGDGYRHWSFFYMIYIPKNHLPTFIACPADSSGNVPTTCDSNKGGVGSYTEGNEYTYWGAYKFNTFNMGCYSSRCPVSNTYGLHTALTNIKKRNYTPIGVVFQQIKGTGDNIVIDATDSGTTLDDSFGGWFALEVSIENISTTQYRVNMWSYDTRGNATQVLVNEVYPIALEAQASTWDQFFFGGNNSGSWVWGPTMVSHYYVDDFIIDDGSKGRIGPRYFSAIGVQSNALPSPAPDLTATPRPR